MNAYEADPNKRAQILAHALKKRERNYAAANDAALYVDKRQAVRNYEDADRAFERDLHMRGFFKL